MLLKTLALSLLLANIARTEDEPQLFSNITLNADNDFSVFAHNPSLDTRALECGIGYSECAYDSTRCCPVGGKCCGNGYCASIGEKCCTGGGTCPAGYKCCAGSRGCAPIGGECCAGGSYCPVGKKCRIYRGRKVCCSSVLGCAGENDGIGSGGTVADSDPTSTSTSTSTSTETETETATATKTYLDVDWDYYYTTIYWTYWFYYWTSYAPYTVQTVTSTKTSTRTVWSVYATNSAVATFSLEDMSSSYTYRPPHSATSLKYSSEPVTLSATGDSVPAATSAVSTYGVIGLAPPGTDAAVGVGISGTGILAAVLVALVGGLAFGL